MAAVLCERPAWRRAALCQQGMHVGDDLLMSRITLCLATQPSPRHHAGPGMKCVLRQSAMDMMTTQSDAMIRSMR